MTDAQEQQRRLGICAACEFRQVKPVVGMVCGICHCPLTNKVKFIRASCPKQKW